MIFVKICERPKRGAAFSSIIADSQDGFGKKYVEGDFASRLKEGWSKYETRLKAAQAAHQQSVDNVDKSPEIAKLNDQVNAAKEKLDKINRQLESHKLDEERADLRTKGQAALDAIAAHTASRKGHEKDYSQLDAGRKELKNAEENSAGAVQEHQRQLGEQVETWKAIDRNGSRKDWDNAIPKDVYKNKKSTIDNLTYRMATAPNEKAFQDNFGRIHSLIVAATATKGEKLRQQHVEAKKACDAFDRQHGPKLENLSRKMNDIDVEIKRHQDEFNAHKQRNAEIKQRQAELNAPSK